MILTAAAEAAGEPVRSGTDRSGRVAAHDTLGRQHEGLRGESFIDREHRG